MSTAPAYVDLDTLVQQLRGDVFARWMRRAQKAALLEWRDRIQPPGLAARFTKAGSAFYGFGERTQKYNKSKRGYPQDYVKSGGFRRQVLKRRPRSFRGGTAIVTKLAYGGGVLNFLTGIGPVTSQAVIKSVQSVPVSGYTYRHPKTGTAVTVQPRARLQITTVGKPQRSSVSYADEFGRFMRDRPWLATRTLELFKLIVTRGAFSKRGKLRSTVLEEVDSAE